VELLRRLAGWLRGDPPERVAPRPPVDDVEVEESEMANKKVKVRDGWQVSYDGENYGGGDTVEAPESETAEWIAAGIADEVKAKPKNKKQTQEDA
jgi:hypothetical protein